MIGRALLIVGLAATGALAQDTRRSGFDFMTPSTQAMQRDDTQNPAMLAVAEGQALWTSRAGAAKACSDCHDDASMRGVAARYPAWDDASRKPIGLGERINACRVRHQSAPAWAAESASLLGVEAWIALQSRGLAVAPGDDARLAPYRERGARWFSRRVGQLDLACVHCHDDRAGQRLAGSVIPQAHIGNYPIYRLEWQSMGSLQRRLRGCLTGVRAEPFAPGAIEWVELELYLAARSRGMAMEAPGVRP